jgi:uncharacterized protein (TIGR00251 family)
MAEQQFKITGTEEGAAFPVHVIPRASANCVAGIHGEAIKIRLTAPPVEGAANQALIKFLSRKLGVSKNRIEIISGITSRNKIVRVIGLTPEQLADNLT